MCLQYINYNYLRSSLPHLHTHWQNYTVYWAAGFCAFLNHIVCGPWCAQNPYTYGTVGIYKHSTSYLLASAFVCHLLTFQIQPRITTSSCCSYCKSASVLIFQATNHSSNSNTCRYSMFSWDISQAISTYSKYMSSLSRPTLFSA